MRQPLRYGGDLAFAPFEWLDAASGQPLGFQVELLAELQRELDQPITIALRPWAETMAAFRAGALVPRPRLQLIRFHGVLAPNARLRALVVPQGPVAAEPATEAAVASECEAETIQGRPHRISCRMRISEFVTSRCRRQQLGVGTTHDMKSVLTDMFLASLLHREYTLGEKINLWRGKLFSGSRLWNTQLSTDLTQKVSRLEVPVYFLQGVFDHTVSYPLAKSRFEQLEAPVKGSCTFKQSAHTPFFEEPDKVREILRGDVLTGANGRADPQ